MSDITFTVSSPKFSVGDVIKVGENEWEIIRCKGDVEGVYILTPSDKTHDIEMAWHYDLKRNSDGVVFGYDEDCLEGEIQEYHATRIYAKVKNSEPSET